MPIFDTDARGATRALAENPDARWVQNGIDVDDSTGPFAVQRLKNDFFTPGIPDSGLRIGPDDSLFAIGSCFARGIEQSMRSRGYDVLSLAEEFNDFELANPQVTGLGFTNKYSTHAILNELRWALDPTADFPIDSLVEIDEGWVDVHTTPTLKWADFDGTVRRHETISEVYRRIVKARVVVITLGLVEVWLDTRTSTHLNMTPLPAMTNADPDRYRFEVSSFVENRRNLEAISELLAARGHPDVQVVVTVSPVPLNATFSDRDVVVANAYSKSTLRSAAEDWAAEHDNVHYFPSYEIVTNSSPGLAWADDGRHVQGQVVGHIMNLFSKAYANHST